MAVAKADWGYKRICQGCGCKFYDMKRDPIVCPSCNAKIDPEALLKSRRPRNASAKPAKAPKAEPVVVAAVAKASEGDDDDAEGDELAEVVKDTAPPDDADLALVEDDDDLDADDDEIAEVVVAKDDDES